MDPSSIFMLFASLPSEIRIKIWRCSLPEPRVVPVRFQRSSSQYISNSAPPTLLHVNAESRSLCRSSYTRLILSPKYESAVFVNFDIDTIFFDNLDCSPDGDLSLDLAKSPHRTKILSCAIDSQLWEVLRVFKYDSLSEVRMMPNLRAIALVMVRDPERRQLRESPADSYGREGVSVRVESNTVGSEMIHVQGWVDNLRADLMQHWIGNAPNVQMWLW